MKKWFALAGFGVGACGQLAVIIFVLGSARGAPGPFETLFLICFVCLWGGAGAVIGLVIGFIVEQAMRLVQTKWDRA